MKENKEKAILQLLRNNPEKGLRIALEAYGGPVMTICRNILFDCDPADIEEAVADSFVGLWRSIEGFREDQEYSLKSYLYGIARHTALDKRRSMKKHAAVTLKDGTIITQKDSSSGGTSFDGNQYTTNLQFRKLINHEQIDTITLNDTVVPLHQ